MNSVNTFIVLAVIWLSCSQLGQSILSPLCDYNIKHLVIDSIVAKDNETLYYFIGDTITVVNTTKNSIENVSKINDFFRYWYSSYQITPPVSIAFTAQNSSTDRQILLVNTEKEFFWDISVNKHWINNLHRLNKTAWHELGQFKSNSSEPMIDVMNVNDKTGYIVTNNIKNKLIRLRAYEIKQGKLELHRNLSVIFIDNKTVGLVARNLTNNEISQSRNELNGQKITSGVILKNMLTLIANRYSCDISLDTNRQIELKIKDFTQELCPKPKGKHLWVLIAMIIGFLAIFLLLFAITVLVVLIIRNCRANKREEVQVKTKNTQNESNTKSKIDEKSESEESESAQVSQSLPDRDVATGMNSKPIPSKDISSSDASPKKPIDLKPKK